LDRRNFSVLFFYKPDGQTSPVLAALRKTKTEKIEKNFSRFQKIIFVNRKGMVLSI